MNLMKLFNFNYFKENLKKSRGLLAFFFGVIPLINLVILICILNTKETVLFNFNFLSIVTYLGLFLVPFVLAQALLGFVFKKKSVDFVMAKPISRKTIYLTNLGGGIVILFLFMLLNTLLFGIFGAIFSKLIIPLGLLWDYFLFWFVAYVFMFVVSMVAITLAGNFTGTGVLVLIIVCLVPFFTISNFYFQSHLRDTYIKCDDVLCKPENYNCRGNKECIKNLSENKYSYSITKIMNNNFTAPILFVNGLQKTIYNSYSLVKMLGLSIIYGVIGFYTFKRRKMENNETSFKSDLGHYFIKTITLLPVTLILYLIIKHGGIIGMLVAGVSVVIYYLIYDLITRKEIYKFRKSLFICLITFGIMIGWYAFYDVYTANKNVVIEIDKMYLHDKQIEVKDKTLMNAIIKDSLGYHERKAYDKVVVKSGNNYYSMYVFLEDNTKEKVNDLISTATKKKINDYKYDNIVYAENDSERYNGEEITVSKEFKKLVKNVAQNYNVEDYSNMIKVYTYKNHNYETINVPLVNGNELTNYVLNDQNKRFLENLEEKKIDNYNFYVDSSDTPLFIEDGYYIFNYVINENLNDFKDYIRKQNNVFGEETLVIRSYNYVDRPLVVRIADAKAFKKQYEIWKNRVENNVEYKSLLDSGVVDTDEY